MIITFDTQNEEEVLEVALLLQNMKVTLEVPTAVETPKDDETPVVTKKVAKTPLKTTEKAIKPTESKVTLGELKELAKTKVTTSDRETVKKIISEYAPKLAEVKPEDYAALAEKLA